MALDYTGLQQYVQDKEGLIGKLINKDTVLGFLMPHEGYLTGPAVLKLFKGDGSLGDCCADPSSASPFAEAKADVACIASGNRFCLKDLAQYIRDAGIRFTAGRESAGSVEEVIMNTELGAVASRIDTLVFQGDTTSANANLNKIDGLIKQATNATDSVKITTSANAYAAIAEVIATLPLEAWNSEIAVFVGMDVAGMFRNTLVGMNLYNYNAGNGTPFDSMNMPGYAGVKIIPSRGLNGTGKIIATPIDNVHYLTNRADDYMQLFWGYSEYHKMYYWNIEFLLGITFGFTDQVVIGTAPAAGLSGGFGLPVSIVSPLDTTGAVVVSQ